MIKIWSHHPGYSDAIRKVEQQTVEEDLYMIDQLFGRENLKYGMSDMEIKEEALRQLEIEWRSHRQELAEILVANMRSE